MHNLNQPSYPTRHSSDLLIATLMLVELQSGLIVILVMSILATGISVIHLTGKSGITGGATPKTAGAFFFAWTLLALGVTSISSVLLSVRGLWSLRRSQPQRSVEAARRIAQQ